LNYWKICDIQEIMVAKEDGLSGTKTNEILHSLQREIPAILVERPVLIAYLYGSVVNGITLPSSDVDIGLVLDPSYTLSAYERTQLEFSIATEVERRCNLREVDVRSIDVAPLTVQGMVLTEGILLYSRDEGISCPIRSIYTQALL
jgi:predicted nucleotidyltransferase